MCFRLASYERPLFDRAIVADKNAELVALYRAIKDDVEPLIDRVRRYQNEHDRRDASGRSELFYEVRERGARLLSSTRHASTACGA